MAVKLRDQGRQGDGVYRLEFLTDTHIPLFEEFVATQPSKVLVSIFRQVLEVIHQKQLKDYHLKVQNGWRGSKWKIVLLHGLPRDGPVVCSQCMSCDLTCPLKLGISGQGEKEADGISALPELQCWLDAQGRDKLIVTPVEHLSSLSEMGDDMMASFWKGAIELISTLQFPTFRSMILNHGSYQNHSHLHLKINVNERFTDVSRCWPEPLQAKFARIQDFAAQELALSL